MAETRFSHRLIAYKIVGHFFGLSYRKIWGSNQVKSRFFRISNILAPCPHAQLEVAQSLCYVDIFRTLVSGSLSFTAMLDFSGKANTFIHGLGKDDTATRYHADRFSFCYADVFLTVVKQGWSRNVLCCLPTANPATVINLLATTILNQWYVASLLVYCRASIADGGLTINQK